MPRAAIAGLYYSQATMCGEVEWTCAAVTTPARAGQNEFIQAYALGVVIHRHDTVRRAGHGEGGVHRPH
ncbi:hypothetical protein RR48_11638 [Papilio machaon]|uniref:Uncharacterized protein n=1 Tax=Papilio machaon TaxID=76193 RepID=A0A194R3W6_PAPMA|nr:hypothetical protein RR48_11638 [Papilio machaon]